MKFAWVAVVVTGKVVVFVERGFGVYGGVDKKVVVNFFVVLYGVVG